MDAAQVPELKKLLVAITETSFSMCETLRPAGGSRRSEILKGCEADGLRLENCPAYVRESIDTEKD
jgi:uroporphyrinogen-III synthase